MPHLDRDGVRLAYDERGAGDPAVVLVHGWSCDRAFMVRQADHFSRAQQVISVDLRGHGESDAPEQAYTVAGFADDLAWMLDRLGVAGAVLVGHSLGGVVVLELARRRPDLAIGVALLDAPVVPIERAQERVALYLSTMVGPECEETALSFVENELLRPFDDPKLRAWVTGRIERSPLPLLVSALADLYRVDTLSMLAGCRAPLLLISADRVIHDTRQLRDFREHLTTGQTVGTGHFHQLGAPEQVNAMIARWLRAVGAPGP